MADEKDKYFRPSTDETLPRSVTQNPAPVRPVSQDYFNEIRSQVELILENFRETDTASNYVAQIQGPYYTLQFQAFTEQIANFAIVAEQTAIDNNYDFTRSEFLYQVIGSLVFPDTSRGIPRLPGDVTYRTFLQQMVDLLLSEATAENQRQGIQIMTNALVTVIEKHIAGRQNPNTFWDASFQHEFEINIEGKGTWTITNDDGVEEIIEGEFGTGFPKNPFLLEQWVAILRTNADLVMRALKPAHNLFEYRHLFRDEFGDITDDPSLDGQAYFYDDFRKFCQGAKELLSDDGETLTDKTLFRDVTLDFKSVRPGATLEILSGPNASPTNGGTNTLRKGLYKVVTALRMPSGADSTPRAYTTSPTGLSGELTVEDEGILNDPNQDWSLVEEGEVVTISGGPNAGNYRLDTLLDSEGGPISEIPSGVGVTRVQVAVSLLRLDQRVPTVVGSQSYRVEVDHLGVRVPKVVEDEDVSAMFFL